MGDYATQMYLILKNAIVGKECDYNTEECQLKLLNTLTSRYSAVN